MADKKNKREKQIEAIFKKYNGSAVLYCSMAVSNKSIARICSSGTSVATGLTISDLINEARK